MPPKARRLGHKAPNCDAAGAGRGRPIVEAFHNDWRNVMRGVVISISAAVSSYVTFVYLITYMQQVDGVSLETRRPCA